MSRPGAPPQVFGSPNGEPGRCNAHLRNGRLCRAKINDGGRCHRHAGGVPAAVDQRVARHGWQSASFLRASAKGREDLAALLADPNLLDAKRPVAVLTADLLAMPVGIDDEKLAELTHAIARRITPVDGETVVVMITPDTVADAMDKITRMTARTAAATSTAIVNAKKVEQANELILLRAVPLLSALGEAIQVSIVPFIPDPVRREEFLAILRNRVSVLISQLSDLAANER